VVALVDGVGSDAEALLPGNGTGGWRLQPAKLRDGSDFRRTGPGWKVQGRVLAGHAKILECQVSEGWILWDFARASWAIRPSSSG